MKYNASIRISEELTITRKFSRQDFLKTSLYNNQNLSVFFWIRKKFHIKSHDFYIGFWFENEEISQIELYCVDENLVNELERKKFNDKFIKTILRENGFKQEQVKSIEDKRDAISSIIIHFN